jgi:hypothetical protein
LERGKSAVAKGKKQMRKKNKKDRKGARQFEKSKILRDALH